MAGCSEKNEKDNDRIYTVFLRDSADGTHYSFVIGESELEPEQIPIVVRWQESEKRVSLPVNKDPQNMSEQERKLLLAQALDMFVLSEQDGTQAEPPSDSVLPDPDEDQDGDTSDVLNPLWVSLPLMDAKSGVLHTFTYDICRLDASVKQMLTAQQDKGPLAIALEKDVDEMTEAEKTRLMEDIIALLTYKPSGEPIATVFVDAGHGYTNSDGVMDKGAGENTPYHELTGKYESDVNLAIALVLKEKLETAGYKVIMSRESEVNEELHINDRARMIKYSGADFAVSIHCNSFDDPSVNGARVYWHENNASAEQSEALAEALAQAINGIENATNKEAYATQGSYAVVRDVHIPSVLVETCFLTGEADAKMASDPMWIYRMAQAVFNGIESSFLDK